MTGGFGENNYTKPYNSRENFSRNLKRLMDIRQCSEADVCRYTEKSSATISDWVNGKKFPRTDSLEKLARFFNVSVFELVCENNGDEERLLRVFRLLSPKGKEKALERMEELKQLYWYNKENVL